MDSSILPHTYGWINRCLRTYYNHTTRTVYFYAIRSLFFFKQWFAFDLFCKEEETEINRSDNYCYSAGNRIPNGLKLSRKSSICAML